MVRSRGSTCAKVSRCKRGKRLEQWVRQILSCLHICILKFVRADARLIHSNGCGSGDDTEKTRGKSQNQIAGEGQVKDFHQSQRRFEGRRQARVEIARETSNQSGRETSCKARCKTSC